MALFSSPWWLALLVIVIEVAVAGVLWAALWATRRDKSDPHDAQAMES